MLKYIVISLFAKIQHTFREATYSATLNNINAMVIPITRGIAGFHLREAGGHWFSSQILAPL